MDYLGLLSEHYSTPPVSRDLVGQNLWEHSYPHYELRPFKGRLDAFSSSESAPYPGHVPALELL